MWLQITFETHNITLPIFPGKSLKLEKYFFYSPCDASSNITPKPTDQSRSNSLSRVLLQIFLGFIFFFIFDQPSQLWVVLLKQSKFRFSKKNGFGNFHRICWVCRTFHPTIWHHGILPENSLKVKKKKRRKENNNNFLYFAWGAKLITEINFCSLKCNWNYKLLIMESYIEINP